MSKRVIGYGALMLLIGFVLGVMLCGMVLTPAEAQIKVSDREYLLEMQKQTRALQSIDRSMSRLVTEVARQRR